MSQDRPLFLSLLPVMLAVAAVFVVTGAMLSALPVFVHLRLGYGADVVGAITAAQFVAALIGRVWAGRMSDRFGPRRVMLWGLGLTVASGLTCLAAAAFQDSPALAAQVLVLGRAMLGAAECFIITSGQTWGLALAGQTRAAAVIGWTGTAMYLALSVGGPIGGWVQTTYGFAGMGVLALAIPVAVLAFIPREVRPTPKSEAPVTAMPILRAVLRPGLAAGLAGLAYASMAFFSALLFLDRGWHPSWAPFSAFALALITVRILAGGLPDRLGTDKTLRIFLFVQIAGLAGVALAPDPAVAVAASLVAGVGYAFIYPALGREAITRVPTQAAGRAVAYFSAFLDLTLAGAGLLLGQIATHVGLPMVFAASALATLAAFAIMATGEKRR